MTSDCYHELRVCTGHQGKQFPRRGEYIDWSVYDRKKDRWAPSPDAPSDITVSDTVQEDKQQIEFSKLKQQFDKIYGSEKKDKDAALDITELCSPYERPPDTRLTNRSSPEFSEEYRRQKRIACIKEHFQKELSNPILTDQDKVDFIDILCEFEDCFYIKGEPLSKVHKVKCHLQVTDNTPFRDKERVQPYSFRPRIKQKILELESMGVIRPSSSPFCSQIVVVPKPSPDGKPRKPGDPPYDIRICVDFRRLNDKLKYVVFPLPRITDCTTIMDKIQPVILSSIDMSAAFWQLELAGDSIEKTAFSAAGRQWEFLRMAFGLKTAPSIFQRFMYDVFSVLDEDGIIYYIDDVLLLSPTVADHKRLLRLVFERLREVNMKTEIPKCELGCAQIKYLGYILSAEGLRKNPLKIAPYAFAPPPNTKRQLMSLLGFASYYRSSIKDFAKHMQPLTSKLKGCPDRIRLDERELAAFEWIKQRLIEDTILHYPNFEKEFILECDGSTSGIGCALMQVMPNGKLGTVSCASRALRDPEKKYTITEIEMLAVVWGLQKFHQYVFGRPVVVHTDHCALRYVLTAQLTSSRVDRWLMTILQYDPKFVFKPGKENVIADYLSRLPENPDFPRDMYIEQKRKEIHEFYCTADGKYLHEIRKIIDTRDGERIGDEEEPMEVLAKKWVAHLTQIDDTFTPTTPFGCVAWYEWEQELKEEFPIVYKFSSDYCQIGYEQQLCDNELPVFEPLHTAKPAVLELFNQQSEHLHNIVDVQAFSVQYSPTGTVLSQDRSGVHDRYRMLDLYNKYAEDDRNVLLTDTITLEDQLSDPFIEGIYNVIKNIGVPSRGIRRWFKAHPAEAEITSDPELVVKVNNKTRRRMVMVPERLRLCIVKDVHEEIMHQGEQKTLLRLQERCWWPAMRDDVTRYIRSCLVCATARGQSLFTENSLISHTIVPLPFYKVCADIIKLPTTMNGISNCLVIIDVFTKYVKYYPLESEKADAVTRTFSSYLADVLFVKIVLTDNGKQFTSIQFRSLCHAMGVAVTYISPYNPRANPAERANQTLLRVLSKIDKRYYNRWDDMLPQVQRAVNSTPSLSTKMSPAEMVYGRVAPIIDSASLKNLPDLDTRDGPYIQQIRSAFEVIHKQAMEELEKAEAVRQAYYNRNKKRDPKYALGQRVWIRRPNLPDKKYYKINPKFIGPYKIVYISPDGGFVRVRPVNDATKSVLPVSQHNIQICSDEISERFFFDGRRFHFLSEVTPLNSRLVTFDDSWSYSPEELEKMKRTMKPNVEWQWPEPSPKDNPLMEKQSFKQVLSELAQSQHDVPQTVVARPDTPITDDAPSDVVSRPVPITTEIDATTVPEQQRPSDADDQQDTIPSQDESPVVDSPQQDTESSVISDRKALLKEIEKENELTTDDYDPEWQAVKKSHTNRQCIRPGLRPAVRTNPRYADMLQLETIMEVDNFIEH